MTTAFDGGEGGWSGGTHAAIVEVDVETGLVRVERYVVAEDCGVLINPAIVEGQVRGGVAQGIGAVLLERSAYDPGSGQYLASTFMDYLLPTASEIPRIEIEHLQTVPLDSDVNFRGVGEGGMIIAPPTAMQRHRGRPLAVRGPRDRAACPADPHPRADRSHRPRLSTGMRLKKSSLDLTVQSSAQAVKLIGCRRADRQGLGVAASALGHLGPWRLRDSTPFGGSRYDCRRSVLCARLATREGGQSGRGSGRRHPYSIPAFRQRSTSRNGAR